MHLVISGLPGSGKSTLAQELSRELRLPWIAKDAILEAIFDSLSVGDPARRVSAEVAIRRCAHRRRHPGHLDPDRTDEQICAWCAEIRSHWPGPVTTGGPLIRINTDHHLTTAAFDALLDWITAYA